MDGATARCRPSTRMDSATARARACLSGLRGQHGGPYVADANQQPWWAAKKQPPRSPARTAQRALRSPKRPLPQRARPPPGEPKPERFLSWRDLLARGLVSSKTSARRLWEQGKFPKPIHISPRVIGWRESEIEAWVASRVH